MDQLMVGRILEIPEHNVWDRQEIVTRTCSSEMILHRHDDAPGSLLIKVSCSSPSQSLVQWGMAHT